MVVVRFIAHVILGFEKWMLYNAIPLWIPFLILIILFISWRHYCIKKNDVGLYQFGVKILIGLLIIHFVGLYLIIPFQRMSRIEGIHIAKSGRLGKPGTISGKVIDEYGDPLQEKPVSITVDMGYTSWSPEKETSLQRDLHERKFDSDEQISSSKILWHRDYFFDEEGEIVYNPRSKYHLVTLSDENGKFIFDCLKMCPQGRWITLRMGDSKSCHVANGMRNIVLRTSETPYKVKLNFISSDEKVSLEKVTILVSEVDSHGGSSFSSNMKFRTDENDQRVIYPLKYGKYEFDCFTESFVKERKVFDLTGTSHIIEKIITMRPGARVRGRIVDTNERPISGLDIYPHAQRRLPYHLQHMLQHWETDKDGVFDSKRKTPGLSDTIPPGKYVLSISADGNMMHHRIYLKEGLNDLGDIIWDPSKR